MKKTPTITRIAILLLSASVLVLFTYVGYMLYQIRGIDSSNALKYFTDVFGVEIYMLVGSVVAPGFYAHLLKQQAKGVTAGLSFDMIVILAISVYEHKDAVQKLIENKIFTQPLLIELGFGIIIPAFILLAILFSSRPMALIATVGVIATTLYNLSIINELSELMSTTAVSVMAISEILFGLGLFLGLLGVKKTQQS